MKEGMILFPSGVQNREKGSESVQAVKDRLALRGWEKKETEDSTVRVETQRATNTKG